MHIQTDYVNDGSGFKAIDPLSLEPDGIHTFAIYEKMRLENGLFRFRCLLADPQSVPRDRLNRMLRKWGVVYIHESQFEKYQQYQKDNLAHILSHGEINIYNKTRTLVDVSTHELKQYFEDTFSDVVTASHAVEKIQQLLSKAIDFLSELNSLNGIAQLIGHDYDTHTHSIKVGWLMTAFINYNKELFAEEYRGDFKQFLLKCAVSGYLHDIGKVKVPRAILNKKGKLDNIEYIVVQSHTVYSISILYQAELPGFAKETILYHHENEDGSGYPSGLKADQIPLVAKICHIVDVFDALTSTRHYKKSKSPFEALKIMTELNPQLETLKKFEKEASENIKTPVSAFVRDDYDAKLRRLREREMIEEEARKRVEARLKLRDQGMAHCFDKDLLRRFIYTINQSKAFDLTGLL